MSLAMLAAAPAEVTLGGQVYRMAPLRIKDQAEFERWVQERVAAMDPNGEPLAVARRVLAIGFYSQESLQAQRSVEGIARLVWLGVRRNHPEVAFDQLAGAATLEELGAAYRVFNRINYCVDAKETSSDPKSRGLGAGPAPAPAPAPGNAPGNEDKCIAGVHEAMDQNSPDGDESLWPSLIALARMFGWTGEEVTELTMGQLNALAEHLNRRPAGPFLTLEEARRYAGLNQRN